MTPKQGFAGGEGVARGLAGPTAGMGELEGPILEALWDAGELSTPEVHERVGEPRGLAYTTILTVLQRLHKKGLVERRGGGRSHVYRPALSREAFAERRAQALAGSLVSLGASGVAAFLAEAERLDPATVERLRASLGGAR